MIKPDTLWSFLKQSEDGSELTVGRVCRALADHDVKPPLDDMERLMLKMIKESNEWHNSAIIKERERKKAAYERKVRESKEISTEKTDSPKISTEKIGEDEISTYPSIRPSVLPSVLPNNKENNIKESGRVFHPPTLEEVVAYCKERAKGVDPNKWYDFYLSKGWMVGKNKMKDWRAAVRTWESGKQPVLPAVKHPEGWRKPEKEQHDGLEGV